MHGIFPNVVEGPQALRSIRWCGAIVRTATEHSKAAAGLASKVLVANGNLGVASAKYRYSKQTKKVQARCTLAEVRAG